jgi:hypothetical protein
MRKIIVLSMITLDGVMQAPGAPEEEHQADSNVAVGLHRILTKFMVRSWKNR